MKPQFDRNCSKCGRLMRKSADSFEDDGHYDCDNCSLVYCRDPSCYCLEGLDEI